MKAKYEDSYVRCLELFAILHEEVGEAQKAFNDYVWKGEGRNIDVKLELDHIQSPLDELRKVIYKVIREKKKKIK